MPLTPEELLANAGWLRRLAVSLVGPAAGADDLVQETWLAALKHPPERDGPIRPWLARVLKNLVKMRHRAASVRVARRAEVEQVEAERAEVASAETVLDRFHAERLLARLVAELDEPYRATVLLRYFEGWSAADIARHQGVPAGTVRWRLKTALDRLRGDLDRESRGDKRGWRLALVPLLPAPAPAPMAVMALKGLWAMTRMQKLVGAVLVLVLLGIGGLFLVRGRVPAAQVGASAPTSERQQPVAAAGVASGRRAPAPRPSAPPPQLLVPARVEHDASLGFGAFSGKVVNFGSGKGVPSAQVTFAVDGASQTVASNAQGEFRFEPGAAAIYVLAVVTAPGFLPFAPEWGTSPIALAARPGLAIRDVTIYLTPAIDYAGVVVDPDGKPVAGAEVRIIGAASGEQALAPINDRFISGAEGEFVFHAHDNALLEARKPGFDPGRARLDRGARVSHRLTLTLGRPGSAPEGLGAQKITGHVLDPSGKPVAGALLRAEAEGRSDLALEAEGRAGPDGAFVLDGLDRGPYRVHATCPGCSAAEAAVTAPGDVTLRLEPGGSITGHVTDGAGSPVPSFTAIVSQKTGPLIEETVQQTTVIDAEGHFEIDGLAAGDYLVRATGFAHAPSDPVSAHVVPGDDPADVAIRLQQGGTIRGRIVERGTGFPLELGRVTVESAIGVGSSAVPLVANTLTDENGEFTLDGIAPGIRSATGAAYGHHMQMRTGLTIEEGHVTGPVTFELSATKDGEEPTMELCGIGASLAADGEALVVRQIISGGGAAQAGMVVGDAVLAIDGIPAAALGMTNAIERIRGPEGTVVLLEIRRAADGMLTPLPVRRVKITL